jgi:multiple sugar transport system substrate-binding protein
MAHKRSTSVFVTVFVLLALLVTGCVAPVAPVAQTAGEGGSRTLHVLSEEVSPESQAFYRAAAADFEKANPGVTVSLDFPSNADALAIRIAAGEPPEIATMQLEQQLYYADQGMLEPATWWFDKHGDDVVDLASVPYNDVYYAIPYALTSEMWWYRADLFEEAGRARPETWADLLDAAKFFNDPANNFYGIAIPAGPSEWTSWHYEIFLWQNGGYVFDTELKPQITAPESIEALQFLKELYQYSPPDSKTWEWWDSIDAFSGEFVAMSHYGGRLLVHTNRDNPELAPVTRVMDQPMGKLRAGPLSRKSHVIFKDAPEKELAKEFLEFLMQPDYLLPFLRTVPVHLTPPLKSLQKDERYLSDPLIQSHLEDMDIVYAASSYGRSLGWESPNHPPNKYAGAVVNANVLTLMVQKILLEEMPIEEAAAWAQEEIIKIQAEVDAGSVK